MQTEPKNSNLVLASLKERHLSDLQDIIGLALTTTIRRAFEAIDPSDEDERLEVLRRFYSFTTMLLAEEAHAWGVVDPLGQLEDEAGMLREGYPELQSAPASRSANARRGRR